MLEVERNIWKSIQSLPKHFFEFGLMKVVIVGAPMWAIQSRPTSNQKGFVLSVDKMHAL